MSLTSDILKSVPPVSVTTVSLAGIHFPFQDAAYAATFVWTSILIGEKVWKGWRKLKSSRKPQE